MCKAFSCLVTKEGTVHWKAGQDSHDYLENMAGLRETGNSKSEYSYARVEIIPHNKENYPYLYPELDWILQVDERVCPTWWSDKHIALAWQAHTEWKEQVYQFDYRGIRDIKSPLGRKIKPNKHDVELLRQWDSVWDSVGASVGDSVGDSVKASVWDSVWALVWASVWDSVWDSVKASVWAKVSSYFPQIIEWKYYESEAGVNPFQSAIDLWDRGLIPSFDGTTWRLHSGKKAEIVFEITQKELKGEI